MTNTVHIVFAFAVVSCLASVLVVLTFAVNRSWQLELKNSKHFLFCLSVYIAVYCVAVCSNLDSNKSEVNCQIQATLIQFFGVGSVMHEAAIALDAYLIINGLSTTDSSGYRALSDSIGDETSFDFRKVPWRYIAIHIFITGTNAIAVGLILYGDFARPMAGFEHVCYVTDPIVCFILGVVPISISLMIQMWTNFFVAHRVINLFKMTGEALCPHEQLRDVVSRLDEKSRQTFFRIVFTPAFYVITALPLLVDRAVMAFSNSGAPPGYMATVAVSSSVFIGVGNLVGWVLTDQDVINSWLVFLCLRSVDDEFRDSLYKSGGGRDISYSFCVDKDMATGKPMGILVRHGNDDYPDDSQKDQGQVVDINAALRLMQQPADSDT